MSEVPPFSYERGTPGLSPRTSNVRGCCTLFIKAPIAPIAAFLTSRSGIRPCPKSPGGSKAFKPFESVLSRQRVVMRGQHMPSPRPATYGVTSGPSQVDHSQVASPGPNGVRGRALLLLYYSQA